MHMRITASLVSTLALAACASMPSTTVEAPAPAVVELQLLGLNDFHGNIEVPGSTTSYHHGQETLREVLGGAARLGATLDGLRAGQSHSLTVAAGDLIGASPFVSANFLDEPAIMALNLVQLDIASVGNHEFDRGIAELQRIQQGGCEQHTSRVPCALEPFGGAEFTYLAGNVVDAGGQSLFPGTALRQLGPATVGFVGLTLKDTATLVAPSMIAGLSFLDEAETANRLAQALVAAGADTVVLLIHEGGRVDPAQNIAGCPNLSGPVVPILAQLDPVISVVVSGHTHQAYVCEVALAGGGTRLLSSAGRNGTFVTDIRLTFDPASERVVAARGVNVPVRESAGARADIEAMVRRYAEAAAPIAARVVGTIAPAAAESEDCVETPAANLVADAQLAQAKAVLGDGTDVAFINTTGVRTGLAAAAADGQITYGEIFAMQPFGNTLQVLEMSGGDLALLLEEQFCGEGLARTCFSLLVPSDGFAYEYDRSRPAGSRVTAITLDGNPLDRALSYRVVLNNFLANGGDGFASLLRHPTVGEAGSDLDALEGYLAGQVRLPRCGRLADRTPA